MYFSYAFVIGVNVFFESSTVFSLLFIYNSFVFYNVLWINFWYIYIYRIYDNPIAVNK